MTSLECYQLMHPELLSQQILLDVLEQKCIHFTQNQTMSKAELIEMFNRVALPFPQRQCDNEQYLGRKIIHLRNSRGISTSASEFNEELTNLSVISQKTRWGNNMNYQHSHVVDRLIPPIENEIRSCTKIQLTNTPYVGTTIYGINKRKNEEGTPACKRRQKITWP